MLRLPTIRAEFADIAEAGSSTPWPRSWSTNSSRPPTTNSSPRPSPARVGLPSGECRRFMLGPVNEGPTGDEEWGRGWTALCQFVAVRGSAKVPARAVAARVSIGAWVAARRVGYWSGGLTADQVAALEGLPGWDWSCSAQARWEAGLAALRRYAVEHETAMSSSKVVVDKFGLGAWAREQRVYYSRGTLPAALVARLEALPGWEWTEQDERWEWGLRVAQRYAGVHDTLDVAPTAIVEGFRLGRWIRRCHEDYRARALTPAQIDALQDLPGWTWTPPERLWDQGLAALRAFYVEHGHCRPQQKITVDGFPLGMWVHNRRRQYRRGDLSAARVAALEELPGWCWWVLGQDWDQTYAVLSRYTTEYGAADPPPGVVWSGSRLGDWVRSQRRRRRSGNLPRARVEQLESLPGWSW